MNILLFGRNGQVGWELQRALSPLGNVMVLDRHSVDYCGDFENPTGIAESILKIKPDVIVNATAYTAVDKAESEVEKARLVNATSVKAMAEAANKIDALVVHYSTDYVFDGGGTTPWKETDSTAPLNAYGLTKREGEEAIIAAAAKYLIFRTSWVYAAKGNNFAKTMIRLAQEREALSVIDDQYGAPTGAELIADCTAHAIRLTVTDPEKSGIYNLIASGITTWHAYAETVIDYVKQKGLPLKVEVVNKVETSAFPTPAKRPLNSRLNTEKFTSAFKLNLPDWKLGVKRMLDELYN
ncbi:dTDP-4-dehydrorhamnose reductase [Pantoea phytobeneficialis]|uniref:dTDP-4-dehydrorhamnose reductase n=1 Tax=Pantoea phytobeneficialis TaxID=2052056 RepID=A0AAP9KQ93_9GAMM|nr:dTDP-4-dehydrorhamnose reductase [Pantoea phytobeneficialis]MDO6405259.1 dTDP-4-dehydrorhamnose reductase [Pantoea phytobeneficialis]QGR07781.1 dTDP-4-dehydrorhamnose reductase [Pantoea phytobeneficialis]